MLSERVIWIALPAHFSEQGNLRISAFVSLRLDVDPASDGSALLGSYSQAVQNWASHVSSRQFTVEFDNGQVFSGLKPINQQDSTLWSSLFPPDTPVGSWAFTDHSKKPIHSFSVEQVLAFLQKLYGAAAAAGDDDQPFLDDPHGPLGLLWPLRDIVNKTRGTNSYEMEGAGELTEGVMTNPEYDPDEQALGNAHRFYYRPWYRVQPPEDAANPEPIEIYAPEFHERLSLLGDFPQLLQRLGLVVVLELPIDGSGLPGEGTVRVHPDDANAPMTAYELKPGDGYFYVRPKNKDSDLAWMRDGWLLCDHDRMQAYQVDVDGAALKMVEFAAHVAHLTTAELRGPATPMQAALPSLRTGGWTVAQRDRASAVYEKFVEAAKQNGNLDSAPSTATLYAEQLIRGWRVDVLDDGRWLSLHHRDVTHTFPQSGANPIAYQDEGFVKGTTATSNPQKAPDGGPASVDLYVHEAIFGWSGWSLGVPRPGKHLPADDSQASNNVEAYDDSKHADYGMATLTEVTSGTLPRLRFGRTYAFRARAVDVAGNGRPYDEALHVDDDLQTKEQMYRRFEPVQSPLLVPRADYTEGESLTHLVIRSNGVPGGVDEVGTAPYAATLTQLTGKSVYRPHADRHVLPPKTSQDIAEAHGSFDAILDPASPVSPANLYNELVVRDAATIPDIDAKSVMDLLHLSDPYAVGVHFIAFDSHGAVKGNEVDHLFESSPPGAGSFRLEIVEGSSFSMKSDPGVVRIVVPKGETVRIELSSLFARDKMPEEIDKLETFAIWDWCENKTADLEQSALAGRHWMLTPRRLVQLTHAVQQPFAIHPDLPAKPAVPDSRGLSVHRRPGETFVTLTGSVLTHARTTGRIDVLASWREAIDDPTDPSGPRHDDRHTTACGIDLDADEDRVFATHADLSIPGAQNVGKYKRCIRCQSLVASAGGHAPCPALPKAVAAQAGQNGNNGHLLMNPAVYALQTAPSSSGAPQWLTCVNCACLFMDAGSPLPCAGLLDHHIVPPISNISYVLDPSTAIGDGGWHRCKNCGVLFNVNAKPWACPGKGPHEPEGPAFVLPRIDRVSKHEFGDTKHRTVVYHSLATTRFREFFPDEIQDNLENLQREEPHDGRDAVPLTHIVPSSARPLAPDIEYVVPTFRWEDRSSQGVMARTRIGRGVRVYLRRPWFSSGDGELLGVLLRQPIGRLTLPIPEDRPVVDSLAPYVTDFGRDPVWEGTSPPASPLVKHFPLAFTHRPDDLFALDELHASVLVAPHKVYWDGESGVWYADIDIDVEDAYFPLVRLALARFQPNSLDGLHLSRIVQTDFIQPLPDRHAWVRLSRGGATLNISGVIGRSLIGTPGDPAHREPPSVTVELQKSNPALGDLGWSTVQEVQLHGSDYGPRRDWKGSIALAPGVVGSQQYRLLFIEREVYPRDTGDGAVIVPHITPTTTRITCLIDFPL
jgi:hypothetical protein